MLIKYLELIDPMTPAKEYTADGIFHMIAKIGLAIMNTAILVMLMNVIL